MTSQPSSSSLRATWEPIKPAAPVIKIRIITQEQDWESGLEICRQDCETRFAAARSPKRDSTQEAAQHRADVPQDRWLEPQGSSPRGRIFLACECFDRQQNR